MSETLNNIRKVLMGEKLFEKCAANGVSNEELEDRLAMLLNRNCLTNCNLQDMINVCQLNTEPNRSCANSIDLDIGKDEPCHKWYEQQNEECPICFDALREGETEYAGKCGHLFHEACLKGYLNTLNERDYKCPTCRGEVFGKFYRRRQPPVRPRQIQYEPEQVDVEAEIVNGEQVILRNPPVTARQDIVGLSLYTGIYFGNKLITIIENHNDFVNFKRNIVPLLRQKVKDIFRTQNNRLRSKMQQEWNELTAMDNEVEDDDEKVSHYINKPTASKIINTIAASGRLNERTYSATGQLNVNATLYDFIANYCLRDLNERDEEGLEGYRQSLMNYTDSEKFLALVLLMVPSFIDELVYWDESESENESEDESEDEYEGENQIENFDDWFSNLPPEVRLSGNELNRLINGEDDS